MMASYTELSTLQNDRDLMRKIAVAIAIAADTVRQEGVGTDNHANRLVWAKNVLANPPGDSQKVLWGMIAANKDLSIADIEAATDTKIQTNVDNLIDLLAGS